MRNCTRRVSKSDSWCPELEVTDISVTGTTCDCTLEVGRYITAADQRQDIIEIPVAELGVIRSEGEDGARLRDYVGTVCPAMKATLMTSSPFRPCPQLTAKELPTLLQINSRSGRWRPYFSKMTLRLNLQKGIL